MPTRTVVVFTENESSVESISGIFGIEDSFRMYCYHYECLLASNFSKEVNEGL